MSDADRMWGIYQHLLSTGWHCTDALREARFRLQLAKQQEAKGG
jgi:hypothetical protein